MIEDRKLTFQDYFQFWLNAQTVFSSHSHLLFEFNQKVFDDKKISYPRIEEWRKKISNSKEIIIRQDFGAGGKTGMHQKVSDIALREVSNRRKCQILAGLTKYVQPHNTLEIGTSLGISSAYIASAYPNQHFITIDGDRNIVNIAEGIHKDLGLENIDCRIGEITNILPTILESLPKIDLVYIDGHHNYNATKKYFKWIESKLHSKSLVVLDDVMWSKGMYTAWNEIRNGSIVKASLQYEGLGFLFFDERFIVPIHEDWVRPLSKPWTRYVSF